MLLGEMICIYINDIAAEWIPCVCIRVYFNFSFSFIFPKAAKKGSSAIFYIFLWIITDEKVTSMSILKK